MNRALWLTPLQLFLLGAYLPSAVAAPQGRIPIAVMDLKARGADESAAAALSTEVSNTLSRVGVFQVITREDIKRMLQLEQQRQQCTGSVDASCMAEIGGALGVEFLVYGEVAKIADTYSLSLVLLDINQAEAANRVNKKITQTKELLDGAQEATRLLVQPVLADRKGFLVLDVREPGAKVTVDGRLQGVTPLAGRMELPMGAHEVTVEKEGFLTYARTVDVVQNQATVEAISLVPSQDFIDDYRGKAQITRISAWGTAGLGAALIGTAVALKLVANSRFDDLINKGYVTQQGTVCSAQNPNYNGNDFCPTAAGYANGALDTISSVETQDTAALITGIVGGASAIVSAVLFAVGDDPARYEVYGAQVASIGIAPDRVVVGWSF